MQVRDGGAGISQPPLWTVPSLPLGRECRELHEPVGGAGSQPPVTACPPDPVCWTDSRWGEAGLWTELRAAPAGAARTPRRPWSAWPSPQAAPPLRSRETEGQPSDAGDLISAVLYSFISA